jgi:UTP--glucose-1-phosphate uridylyltransferase
VLLGDDLIDERDPLLSTMIAENERTGLTVIALMEVDPEHIHLYGVAEVEPTDIPTSSA